MKVMFLHRLWPVYGGGETVTVCLANEMVNRGIDVHVAYFRESDKGLKRPMLDERIQWHLIEGVEFNEYSKDFFIKKHEARYINEKLIGLIQCEHIDILHNQWWPVEFFKEAKIRTGIKVVTVLHMQVDIRKAVYFTGVTKLLFNLVEPFYRYVEKQKNLHRSDKYYQYSDKYIFLAKDFMDYYRKERGLSMGDGKIDYIYNPSTFNTYSDEERLKEKMKEVLVVGRLVESHKQIFRLLQAWKLVLDKGVRGWRLTIVGEGPDRQRYEDFIVKKKIGNVYFEGFQQPLIYYKRASIFCMTSAYEGFCMTLLEAMQNGCVPVVMDTFAACRVIVQDGKNGILVKDGDVNAFANAIICLIRNCGLRIMLKKNGLKSCRVFHVTKIVDRWEQLYNELIVK